MKKGPVFGWPSVEESAPWPGNTQTQKWRARRKRRDGHASELYMVVM